MTQNEGQNFGSSSRALGAFDQRGPYGILIHLGVDFVKMNESQFRAENPAAKYPLPYRQKLLSFSVLKSPLKNLLHIILQGATKVLLRYKRRYRDEMSNNNSIHLKP